MEQQNDPTPKAQENGGGCTEAQLNDNNMEKVSGGATTGGVCIFSLRPGSFQERA